MTLQRASFATVVLAVLTTSAYAFETNGTKWGMGPNSATYLDGHQGTPGDFTWSIMGDGLAFEGYETHFGAVTTSFGNLVGTSSEAEEIEIIDRALQKWASVCGLTITGPIADSGVAGGAPEAIGGHLADMRFGAVEGGFGNVSAHAYQPGNESIYGTGGSITGDIHLNTLFQFVDDPNHVGNGQVELDFETLLLHEIGHSIGLTHTNVVGSVMHASYNGARRELSADDIAGAQFIYGPVPEPFSLSVLGILLALANRRRRTC